MCPGWLAGKRLVHFVDSTSALACIVRAYSTKKDLSLIAGRLWFEATALMLDYSVRYVNTKENLADGPSRGDVAIMEHLGACEITGWKFPDFSGGLGGWMCSAGEEIRLVL